MCKIFKTNMTVFTLVHYEWWVQLLVVLDPLFVWLIHFPKLKKKVDQKLLAIKIMRISKIKLRESKASVRNAGNCQLFHIKNKYLR